MQLINRAPSGLLSRFDMKAGGQNPSQLPDFVQPTVEISQLYEVDQRLIAIDTFAAGVVGPNGGSVTPAAGFIWHVTHVGGYCIANLAAGEACRFRVGIYATFLATFHALTQAAGSAIVGERPAVGTECDLYMRPGDALGAFIEQITLTPDIRVVAFYNEYRV